MTIRRMFIAAIVFSPRHGTVRRIVDKWRLRIRIAAEDTLGILYRREESPADSTPDSGSRPFTTWLDWMARRYLIRHSLVTASSAGELHLSEKGRATAKSLVRSHRLWETYMSRHFGLPDDHLHATAEQVEHFLSPELQTELAEELDRPDVDPHGKSIPGTAEH